MENAERKEIISKGKKGTSIRRHHCVDVVCCFCCLAFSMQYSQYRISKYWELSSIDTRKYLVWAVQAV